LDEDYPSSGGPGAATRGGGPRISTPYGRERRCHLRHVEPAIAPLGEEPLEARRAAQLQHARNPAAVDREAVRQVARQERERTFGACSPCSPTKKVISPSSA
jgi:hypothetical protein